MTRLLDKILSFVNGSSNEPSNDSTLSLTTETINPKIIFQQQRVESNSQVQSLNVRYEAPSINIGSDKATSVDNSP